jgi:hypothetical protein
MDEHATLPARIRAAWIDLLRRNKGAEGRPDQYYALSVENIQGDGATFELCLTFRAGRAYCCCEDMCHTGAFTDERGRQVRAALAVPGVEPREPLVVRIARGWKRARDCATARVMRSNARCTIEDLGC